MVYLAAPYGGKKENLEKITQVLKILATRDPKQTYFSPIHAFGTLYDDVSYLQGMDMCLHMLDKSDEVYFLKGWEESRGCAIEYGYANARGITSVVIDIHSEINEQSHEESIEYIETLFEVKHRHRLPF